MKPKYNVGDLLLYNYCDGTTGFHIVDYIEQDDYGRNIYYHKHSDTFEAFIYEENVVDVIKKDSEKYKRYQLYLELKKEFGE